MGSQLLEFNNSRGRQYICSNANFQGRAWEIAGPRRSLVLSSWKDALIGIQIFEGIFRSTLTKFKDMLGTLVLDVKGHKSNVIAVDHRMGKFIDEYLNAWSSPLRS